VDEARIRQVLANLLGNVRAHTPVTTPVAVRLGPITGGVLIEVADAGPGMNEQDALRAFDRFHRAAERAADPAECGESRQDDNRQVRAGVGAGPAGHEQNGSGRRAEAAGSGTATNGHGRDGTGRDEAAASPARAERTSGSGLGLSIVQAIANAHGGRATLESWPGQGTKVRIWLPVRTVP
jgi:signal transduction histidine kinase